MSSVAWIKSILSLSSFPMSDLYDLLFSILKCLSRSLLWNPFDVKCSLEECSSMSLVSCSAFFRSHIFCQIVAIRRRLNAILSGLEEACSINCVVNVKLAVSCYTVFEFRVNKRQLHMGMDICWVIFLPNFRIRSAELLNTPLLHIQYGASSKRNRDLRGITYGKNWTWLHKRPCKPTSQSSTRNSRCWHWQFGIEGLKSKEMEMKLNIDEMLTSWNNTCSCRRSAMPIDSYPCGLKLSSKP